MARPQRTGKALVLFVLQRLRDAGQDVEHGRLLGRERAAEVAEQACREWLDDEGGDRRRKAS